MRLNNDSIVPLLHDVMGISSPARKGRSSRYEQAEALAKVIEQISLVDGLANQSALVRKAIFHSTPEVSAWAIRALAKSSRDTDKKYLRELVGNKNVAILGRVALDSVLMAQNGDAWAKSLARKEFLKALLAGGDMRPFEAMAVVSMLDVISQHDPIGRSELVDLVETAIANKGMPKVGRDNVFRTLGRMARTGKDNGKAFELLVDEIDGKEESSMVAVHVLRNDVALDDANKESLRKLRGRISDSSLQSALDEVLKKPIVARPSLP